MMSGHQIIRNNRGRGWPSSSGFNYLVMKIKVKKLRPDAIIPGYSHKRHGGMDLFSLDDYELQSGERRIFPVGLALEFPTGYAAIVKDKSSLSRNGGVHT